MKRIAGLIILIVPTFFGGYLLGRYLGVPGVFLGSLFGFCYGVCLGLSRVGGWIWENR